MQKAMMFAALLTSVVGVADEIDVKHEKLLYPVVRVRTERAGGSGTIIYSEDRVEKGSFRTYILTNHHVVDDAIKVNKRWDNLKQDYVTEENNELVDVEIFSWSKGTIIDRRTVRAFILAHSAEDDIAVLELRSNDIPYPVKTENVAQLANKEIETKLRVFQPTFVVGCSLGHDPIHSTGEITDLSDLIDGKTYMMGSAQVIYGNSGGAVFAQIDGKFFLIGIPARVAIGGGSAVTHMNWFVPSSRIRSFFDKNKLAFFFDKAKTPEEAYKEREKLRQKGKETDKDGPPKGGDGGNHDHDHEGEVREI